MGPPSSSAGPRGAKDRLHPSLANASLYRGGDVTRLGLATTSTCFRVDLAAPFGFPTPTGTEVPSSSEMIANNCERL